MNSNVTLSVFGANAHIIQNAETIVGGSETVGQCYDDKSWGNINNTARTNGYITGIASSIFENTVLKQNSVMSVTLAQILSTRNSAKVNYSGDFGTNLADNETDISAKIMNMSSVFNNGNFLFDNEVTTSKLSNGAVTNSKIGSGAVTGSSDGSNPGKIAQSTITSYELKDGCVVSSKLSDNSVVGTKIVNGVVTPSKFASILYAGTGSSSTKSVSSSASGLTVSLNQNSTYGISVSLTGTPNKISSASNISGKGYLATVSSTNSSISYSSNVYISSNTLCSNGLNVTGNASATGTVTATTFNALSDVKFKSDLRSLSSDLKDIKTFIENTDLFSYRIKNDELDEFSIGVIAQDIKDSYVGRSNFVSDSNGVLTVKETKFIYLLWEYVKDLNARVQMLEGRII